MLTAVYLKVILESSLLLIAILKVPNSRAPLVYACPKHLFNRLDKSLDLQGSQRPCRAVRTNPGLKQGFIRIDIANAADETLI